MLSFLFEGQIFYSLASIYNFDATNTVFFGTAGMFAGLLLCGLFIRTQKAAHRLFLYSYLFFIAVSVVFFYPPSMLWKIGIIVASFLAGNCVAAWAFYLKGYTPQNERIKTAADMLILSNVLMTLLDMAAVHISPYAGLSLGMLMLLVAALLILRLPKEENASANVVMEMSENSSNGLPKLLIFLSLFIVIITINSGLMYRVVRPAFAHLENLTSWYWATPYIVALAVMRNLPQQTDRTYILYVAIAMIGFSFIGFMLLGRDNMSYFIINTLMLGACGVCDLFWWSILGEMLEYSKKPAKVMGVGLSANVLGVLLGGVIGNAIVSANIHNLTPSVLALIVVFITLILLPPLHRELSSLLTCHAYLTVFSELPAQEQSIQIDRVARFGNLSERESQVATLLLQGLTYKSIADELVISENTVKYYVKNIYSKFGVQSRAELIFIVLNRKDNSPFEQSVKKRQYFNLHLQKVEVFCV